MADTSPIENKIGILIWKTSNFWQANLRRILSAYNLSLNEYLILLSIKNMKDHKNEFYQNEIANLIGIDVSVASVTFKLLERKKYISRKNLNDNRKKIIEILKPGNEIFKILKPLVDQEEDKIFKKLNNEIFNFTNSLKLLLGKKIRIKANKYTNDRI